MSVQAVLNGICTYFGGTFDPTSRTYRTSPVAGVGVVRRGWAKRDDHDDYFNGMQPGAQSGSQVVVHIARQHEQRVALGGEHSGMKRVVYEVELMCYIRSRTPHAEDGQDDQYALRDALVEHMRADRTLGGAVFQAGEHIDGGLSTIEFEYGQPASKAELTKSFLSMRFAAIEYVFA